MFALGSLGGWAFLTSSYKILSGNHQKSLSTLNSRGADVKQRDQQLDIQDWAHQEGPFEPQISGEKTDLHHAATQPLSNHQLDLYH